MKVKARPTRSLEFNLVNVDNDNDVVVVVVVVSIGIGGIKACDGPLKGKLSTKVTQLLKH